MGSNSVNITIWFIVYFMPYIYVFEGGKKIPTSTWIHFIDSGGQPEFHDLLPLFLPNTSVVIFVFKLSEGLDQKPIVEYFGPDGRPIGDSRESYLTHKEILKHSLKVLKAQKDNCPIILVVGTHKDCHPQKFNIEELRKCLDQFYENVFQFGDDPIALINCLESNDDIKKILDDIKNGIMSAARDVVYEPTPLAWFGLELALKKASQSSMPKGILLVHNCKEEAERFSYFKGRPDRFETALKHLVKNNIFLYYQEILDHMVFCDPQSLLNSVTEIVRQHYKLVHSKDGRIGALLMFEKHAYISDNILRHILPQYNDEKYILKTEELFKLLTKLNVISEIRTREKQIFYLMPALLSNTQNPIEIAKDIYNDKFVPPLCINFEGCAPSGLFCSLVTHLLHSKDWELCMSDNKPAWCYRNCVAFICDKQTIVTLVDLFSHLRIYIQSPPHTAPYIINDMVQNSIAAVRKCLSFSHIKYDNAIECPEHPGQHNHVAVWHHTPDEEYYECKKDNFRRGPIHQKYQIWNKPGMLSYCFFIYILVLVIDLFWISSNYNTCRSMGFAKTKVTTVMNIKYLYLPSIILPINMVL